MCMKMKYMLAYGSNLDIEQMRRRCPDAVPVGTAEILGYRLLFKGSKTGSYLTIEKKARRKIPVLVWQVSDADEAILDRYEGFPIFYRKETMEVKIHDLQGGAAIGKANAFVYLMDESRPLGAPADWYYVLCADAYRRLGFDRRILEKAYLESTGRRHLKR